MLVYISGTALSVLLAYMSTHIGKSRGISRKNAIFLKKLFAFFSFLPLTVISAIRFYVGKDYPSYRDAFIHLDKTMISYAQKGLFGENGFSFMLKLLSQISNDPQIFFVASSLMTCAFYYIAIYRESLSPAHSVLLFVIGRDFFSSLTGIRQYMAIAIASFSIPLIKEKKWVKAIAVLLLASTFHTAVLLFAVIYVMYFIEIPPKIGWIMVAITTVVSRGLVGILIPMLNKYNLYYVYFSGGISEYNSDGDAAMEVLLISLSFYIFMCCIYRHVKNSKNLKLMYSAVLFGLLASTMSPVLPKSSYRLTWFMNIFIVLYTPQAIKSIKNKRIKQLLYYGITGAYFGTTIYGMLLNGQRVLPYRTFWM